MLKLLKFIFNIWFLCLIFFLYLVYLFFNPSGCSYPIKYSLDNIDPRFEISQEDAVTIVNAAEKIWEDSMSMDIFEYDSTGKLKINFVFDERQQRNINTEKAKNKIIQSESSVEEITNQHENLLILYNQQLASHDTSVKNYDRKMDDYNQTVNHWNKAGGAPTEEYQKLLLERSDLDAVYKQLSIGEEDLSELISKINALSEVINLNIEKHNTDINIFNNEFGTAREFDQGDYLAKTINIYEFRTMSDLKLVIAHEMGHALGLDHVDDPYSLMYYLMEKQDLNNIKLSEDDIQALKQRCRIK